MKIRPIPVEIRPARPDFLLRPGEAISRQVVGHLRAKVIPGIICIPEPGPKGAARA